MPPAGSAFACLACLCLATFQPGAALAGDDPLTHLSAIRTNNQQAELRSGPASGQGKGTKDVDLLAFVKPMSERLKPYILVSDEWERLSEEEEAAIVANRGRRYIFIRTIAEQRNSRLVSFLQVLQLGAISNRTVVAVAPFDLEYNFEPIAQALGVPEIITQEEWHMRLKQDRLAAAFDASPRISFHSCPPEADACIPCVDGGDGQSATTFDEYVSYGTEGLRDILMGDSRIVRVTNYKRCGYRDDPFFAEATKLLVLFSQQWYEEGESFVRSVAGVQDSRYIAAQIRTEKWRPPLSENCTLQVRENFVRAAKKVVQATGIDKMYLASDALPDGQTYSGTFKMTGRAAKPELRGRYQDMIQQIMEDLQEFGVIFMPGYYVEEMERPKSARSAYRSMMDQIICQKSVIFLATCLGMQREYPDRKLMGGGRCTAARKKCGNYAEWILRARDQVEGAIALNTTQRDHLVKHAQLPHQVDLADGNRGELSTGQGPLVKYTVML